jgi:hypothetical protein
MIQISHRRSNPHAIQQWMLSMVTILSANADLDIDSMGSWPDQVDAQSVLQLMDT